MSSETLRVLVVTKGLDIGGIERMVVDLARGLTAAGQSVEVALVNDSRDRLVVELDQAGVIVHRLGGTDRIGLRAAARLARLCRREQYDVVHVHGPLLAFVARVVVVGIPIVTTCHTPFRALHPVSRVLWRLSVGRDAETVAVSTSVATSFARRNGRRPKVISHGADSDRVAAALAGHRERAPEGVTVFVAVASHRAAKNYPVLLRALRLAIDAGCRAELVAIGDGPDLPVNRRLADELRLGQAVHFQPARVDVYPGIAAGDVLVVSSDFEGQPLVVAEAMALGKPVIATSVGLVPDLVTFETGRVVPVGDVRALADALIELAGNADLRTSLGEAGAVIAGRWTLRDAIEGHVALYRAMGR